MNNPFDENEQKDKHEFFRQMTSAINDWMINQYPAFDTHLVHLIEEIRVNQQRIRNIDSDLRAELSAMKERHKNYITAQIDAFMEKKYPDVSDKITQILLEIDNYSFRYLKLLENIDIKFNNLISKKQKKIFKELDDLIKSTKNKFKEYMKNETKCS